MLIRIHGQYYDLSKFNHPGGPQALQVAEGRDATALYESHHQFSDLKKMEAIRQKLLVYPPNENLIPLANEYDWDLTMQSAFTKELRQRANEILSRDNIKANAWRWFEMILFGVLFLYSVPYFIKGSWIALFVTPFLIWLFSVNSFHDASHFSVSDFWPINTFFQYIHPWFSSPIMWAHQHIIGHHCYPNIPGMDPDLYHAPKLIRHTQTMKHRPAHVYQTLTFIITWIIGLAFMAQVNTLRMVLLGSDKFNRTTTYMKMSQTRKAMHVGGRLLTICAIYVWPFFAFSLGKALIFAILPIYMYSILFMVSTQINHLIPDSHDVADKNFFIHQILTSHNVATDNYMVYLLTGGLNHQIEHHLFPSVNHCHLRELGPMVKELCKKYGVKYNESLSLWEALCKHVEHLRFMSIDEKKKQ